MSLRSRNRPMRSSFPLSRFGYLNIPHMESVSGMEREQLMSQLVEQGMAYVDPEEYKASRTIKYVTSGDYLSGNVRKKLELAQEMADREPGRSWEM